MAFEVTKEELFKKADNGEFLKWGFEYTYDYAFEHGLSSKYATGYEDIDFKSICTPQQWEKLGKADKDRVIKEFLDIYLNRNIFPMTYFSEEGVENEIQMLKSKTIKGFDETVKNPNGGGGLNNFFFPNLQTAYSQGVQKGIPAAMWDRFNHEETMARAITISYDTSKAIPSPTKLYGSLKLVSPVPTNFAPMNARELMTRYTPDGGRVWDYCTGFGGRLLGTLTSPKNITYIGTDPNTETMYNLHRMAAAVKQSVENDFYNNYGEVNYELRCMGAEDYDGEANSIDFAFSSPPYFDLEIYSDEETQSVNKFEGLDAWLEGFVRPVIKNLYRVLKPGAMYAVNAADFEHNGKTVNFVDDWKRISHQEGFDSVRGISLGLTSRPGSGAQKMGIDKKEVIYMFRKPL